MRTANVENGKSTMVVALWAILYCLLSSFALASFESSPIGGRGVGVDGAMTAMADDVFSLYYNPAGAAFLTKPEVGAYYGRLYGGLSDNSNLNQNFLGYVYPFQGEAIGFSYTALTLTDLYKEQTFGMSYSWKIGETFSMGVTGKHYRKSVGHDFNTDNAAINGTTQIGTEDPVFLNGHKADAWGGDISALYFLGNGWSTGLMARNVNEPNIAFEEDDRDRIPRSVNLGVARKWKTHAVMLDVTRERFTQMETSLHAGAETWVMGSHIGLRAGAGLGQRDAKQVTAGFSYRLSFMQVDYGWMIPIESIDGTTGIQQLSLIFRYGLPPAKPLLHLSHDDESMMELRDLLSDNVMDSSTSVHSSAYPRREELLIVPSYVALLPGQSFQFRTQSKNLPDGRLIWELLPPLGTLSQSGIYEAPDEVLFPQDVWITAKSESSYMHYERAVVHLKPNTHGAVTLSVDVGWDTGEVAISPDYYSDVERIAIVLRQYPHASAVIKGYSDDGNSLAQAQSISEKRARAVRSLLVDRFHVEAKRVMTQKAEAFRDKSADDRKLHRWVEAVLTGPDLPSSSVPDLEVNP